MLKSKEERKRLLMWGAIETDDPFVEDLLLYTLMKENEEEEEEEEGTIKLRGLLNERKKH